MTITVSLTTPQLDRLEELEQVIERGLTTFVEVGQALTEVRDSRLYVETYGTFEDYCRERFGLKRQRAYELMEASAVVSEISDTDSGLVPPRRESQAAALAPLRDKPAQLREAWTETVEKHGPAPTAAQVREHVEPRRERPVEEETVKPSASATKPKSGRGNHREFYRTYDGPLEGGHLNRANAAKRRVETVVGQCSAWDRALNEVHMELAARLATPDERDGWRECISAARRALLEFERRIPQGGLKPGVGEDGEERRVALRVVRLNGQ